MKLDFISFSNHAAPTAAGATKDANPIPLCPAAAALLPAALPAGKSSPLAEFLLLLGARRQAALLMTAGICEY